LRGGPGSPGPVRHRACAAMDVLADLLAAQPISPAAQSDHQSTIIA
jgi:hypothetical protein